MSTKTSSASRRDADPTPDLDALLHPASAFASPADVVSDPDLTLYEKRAILASWASDACAVEAVPALRRPPGSQRPVTFDDVMDALRALDNQENESRRLRKGNIRERLARRPRGQRADGGDHGRSLN